MQQMRLLLVKRLETRVSQYFVLGIIEDSGGWLFSGN